MFTKLSRTFVLGGQKTAFVCLVAVLFLQTACGSSILGGSSDDSQATIAALQATINAPTVTPVPTNTPEPTPIPPTAVPPTQAPPPTVAAQPTVSQAQAPQAPANLEELIANSNVLLYEDVAGYPNVYRYVAASLDRLGFRRGDNFVDVGDAEGRLLDQMLGGTAPNGKPWDLIIIANEMYDDVISGEFFETLEGILARGDTYVILEHYNLEELHFGTVKPVLLRCGVDVRQWNVSSPNDLNLYIPDQNHPSVSELVKITGFRVADTWSRGSDVGDLMYKTTTGDAKIVLKTRPLVGDDTEYAALVECINGHLLLQTTSTHNYLDETMVSMWANNIHYMLRKKHGG